MTLVQNIILKTVIPDCYTFKKCLASQFKGKHMNTQINVVAFQYSQVWRQFKQREGSSETQILPCFPDSLSGVAFPLHPQQLSTVQLSSKEMVTSFLTPKHTLACLQKLQ